ncbi:MAG: DUF4292 domain-containing protein [Candidatus Sumerlaeia bacterium]
MKKHQLKHLIPFSLLAFAFLLAAGCSSVKMPVEPFETPAATTDQLADRMADMLSDFDNMTVKIDALAGIRFRPGKRKHILYVMYAPPKQAKLGLDDKVIGALYRVIQNGDAIAIYDRNLQAFYVGKMETLRKYPGSLYGIEPLDIAGIMLAMHQAAEGLRAETEKLPEPSFWNRSRKVQVDLTEGRRAEYVVRLQDGAVCKMEYYDADGRKRAEVDYETYAFFGEGLFPSEFEIRFSGSGLELQGDVEYVKLDRNIGNSAFALRAPENVPTYPLEQWFQDLEGQ